MLIKHGKTEEFREETEKKLSEMCSMFSKPLRNSLVQDLINQIKKGKNIEKPIKE